MKYREEIYSALVLILISGTAGAMKRPVVQGKSRVAREVLFDSPTEPNLTCPTDYYISRKQILIDYLQEQQVPNASIESMMGILSRPLRLQVPHETYFEDSYWISNPGRDLRGLANDLINELKRPVYVKITKDPQFIEQVTAYLSDRYRPILTEQLRVVIPLGSLPATSTWITDEFTSKRTERRKNEREKFEEQRPKKRSTEVPLTFEERWCKELSILAKWLDAGAQTKDHFYEEGILLLLNNVPPNHPLITKPSHCLKDLLSQVARKNEHKRILDALNKKGIK